MNAASNVAATVMDTIPTSTTTESRDPPNGETMRALAWFGKHDVRIIDAAKPQVTEPTDVVVAVTGSTVCGSDLHLYNGEILQLQKGDILGHEFCGVVESVGSSVSKWKVGDRVVASFQIACGQCEYCKKGLSSMCDTTNSSPVMNTMYGHRFAGLFGYSHFAGGFAGGQAEYVRVPWAETNLLKIPDGVPDERALYLSDIVCTAYHACKEANVQEGDVVGLWGLGPIGLLCAQWCKLMGAKRIIGIDNVTDRLDFAQKKYGVEPLNFAEKDTSKGIQEMVPGGLDKAIDCAAFRYAKGVIHKVERALALETDTSETVNEMITLVKKFGTCVLIADYAGLTNHFNIGALMEKGVRLIGGGQAPVQMYWEELMEKWIKTDKFKVEDIVTHRFTLEDVPGIYDVFDKKEEGIMKCFVQTKHSKAPAAGTPRLSHITEGKVVSA
ncbi:hypothetical protein YB2330_003171 [Saitoella coloradoensis]